MSFVFILIFSIFLNSKVWAEPETEWAHNLKLEENSLEINWNSEDPEWLIMQISAPVKGYVSIGFSPNGAMKGSDIVMGWVDENGKGFIKDLHVTSYRNRPFVDTKQDYELLESEQNENGTRIKFRREWDTCDDLEDRKINHDSTRLIWATSEFDPEYKNNGDFYPKYHNMDRGVIRTFIRSKTQFANFPDEDGQNENGEIKYFDLSMKNNPINGEDDVYFCKIEKFPFSDQNYQLVGYRPLLDKGNELRIHHIIVSECIASENDVTSESIFEKYSKNPGGRCYTPEMPSEYGKYCSKMMIVWTSGSKGTMFPENIGWPLGEQSGGATYFMFEIHYDNPALDTFKDNSGFRFFYTDKSREFEASSLQIGTKVSPFLTIPHKMPSFTKIGYCAKECTNQAIPEDGITVMSVLLHAHLAGKAIKLRHIRNGVELEPIAVETHYDFNYQQARILTTPRKILPGDELLTECEYNTTWKDSPSFGGLGVKDEMCLSFLYYYPRIDLNECKTQLEFNSFLNALGVEKVEGEILNEINMPYAPAAGQVKEYGDNPYYLSNSTYENPLNALDAMIISSPSKLVGNSVKNLIKELDWSSSEGKSVEEKWLNGDHYAFCTGHHHKRYPLNDYIVKLPEYQKYKEPINSQC